MRYSQKFLIAVFLILVIVFATNFFALRYFTAKYFDDYLQSRKQNVPDVNFDVLSTFINNKNLDDKTIKEYIIILKDLATLSESLEKFSQDPKIGNVSVLDSLQKYGVPSSSIEQYLSIESVAGFASNLSTFSLLHSNTTPEGIFVMRIIVAMLIVNGVLIVFIGVGTYTWVRFSFAPVRSATENIRNIIARREYKNIEYRSGDEFGALITVINNLNHSLSRQEKIRSDFLSDFSHEIKTPIAAIQCYLEGMSEGIIEPDPESIDHLAAEVSRLIRITNTLMEYEKLSHERREEIRPQTVETVMLFRRIADEYRTLLTSHHQHIALPTDPVFMITVDEDRWYSLVHNIVSNFIKYAGENTTLTITCREDAKWSIIRFADDGIGVADKEVPLLREKFYRAEKSRTKDEEGDTAGIGIGLSIVERIVTLHSGIFTIKSGAGKGFAVEVNVPR